MKSVYLPLVLWLLVASAQAEGIALDEKGNLYAPHTFIDLSPSQVEEMEVFDTITLTKEQWSALRKFSPNIPKRLSGILPVTWNDCTCAVSYDAVRLTNGRIAVFKEEQTPDSISWRINPYRPLTLHCDRRGQFYLNGILVRFPILLEAIRSSRPIAEYPADHQKSPVANIKIPIGMKTTDPVFENRIVEVYEALEAKGWKKEVFR